MAHPTWHYLVIALELAACVPLTIWFVGRFGGSDSNVSEGGTGMSADCDGGGGGE